MIDIMVIAVNQLSVPIRDWAIKIVGDNEVLTMLHLRVDDNRYQIGKEFGEKVFDSLYEARDYIDIELNKKLSRIN